MNRPAVCISYGAVINRCDRARYRKLLHHRHEAFRSRIQGMPGHRPVIGFAPLHCLQMLVGCEARGLTVADEPYCGRSVSPFSFSNPLFLDENLQIGHLHCFGPLNTLSSSFWSLSHCLEIKGMPIAHKPHPKKGTHFNCCFANQQHRPSIPTQMASCCMKNMSLYAT